MKVNAKLKEGFEDFGFPEYHTKYSAAIDLRAAVDETVIIKSGDQKLISSGLFMEIPEGYNLRITPRSGLAMKRGISIVNSPGIIDADYRGEIGVVIINFGKEDFVIERGDRIAQATFSKFEQAEFVPIETLSETKRGAGGFGSTGHK